MPADRHLRVDAAYAEARLAALYDPLNAWGPGDDFYLELVARAPSALDVGCGTGELLARARAAGHTGRLTGVDPAEAMLEIARAKRSDVAWVLGYAETFADEGRYDLATMTGHAFQVLLDDDAVLAALRNVARHLAPGGRFAFETRNPAARAWSGGRRSVRAGRGRAGRGDVRRLAHPARHPRARPRGVRGDGRRARRSRDDGEHVAVRGP